MMKLQRRAQKVLLVLGILALSVGVVLFLSREYTKIGAPPALVPGQRVTVTPVEQKQIAAVGYRVESVAQGLEVPWSIAFTSKERMLVTERIGRIRVIENGKLKSDPAYVFPEVSQTGEEGLMGLDLDPEYAKNQALYVCLAYKKNDRLVNKVVRLIDAKAGMKVDSVLLDDVPAARFHAGCRLKIGPDKKLYLSTGDALEKDTAQDLSLLSGKILRINLDGSVPTDNPFPNSLVYSYGHRNAQGFDWHPVSGAMVATEHGPSLIDGPAGGDEVNFIQAGKNYGWPLVSHEKQAEGTEAPLVVYTPAVAPASGFFYRGTTFPQFTNAYFFGGLADGGLHVVHFVENTQAQVESYERLVGVDVGRVREVVEGTDGLIYFTTSNRDGRGSPRTGDDQIFRLVPLESN